MDPKVNKVLLPMLKELVNCRITMDTEVTKQCKNIIEKSIKKDLIDAMKQTDTPFSILFLKICHAGSMSEGLRVKEATEFDLNVILRYDKQLKYIKSEEVQVECNGNMPVGFVKVKVPTNLEDVKHLPKSSSVILSMIENGYLNHETLKIWMESVVNRALNKLYSEPGNRIWTINKVPYRVTVTRKPHSPAITLYLAPQVKTDIDELDIDLVPIFVFPVIQLSDKIIRKDRILGLLQRQSPEFYAVPKPPSSTDNSRHLYWRIACTTAEKELLNGTGSLKLAVKLFKCLRDDLDDQKWICSYHIKTMAFWLSEQLPVEYYKDEKNLPFLFIMMLQSFTLCLRQRTLPFFWNPSLNLWEGVPEDHFNGLHGRYRNMLNVIERSPLRIIEYFNNRKANDASLQSLL